jgi:chromosome segregation ATPase
LGIKDSRPGFNTAQASIGDLLNYLIEKFHFLISILYLTRVEQLKEEQKAKVRAEYEVYELKKGNRGNTSTNQAINTNIRKLSQELEKMRQSYSELEQSYKELTKGITSKNDETILFSKKLEELIKKKNRLQKECSSLREENRILVQENNGLETGMEALKKQSSEIQKESKKSTEELRNALKKNSTLTKQITASLLHNI